MGVKGIVGQLLADLAVIVDLAVEDDHEAAVGAVHRLVPAGDVEDREPTHPEPEAAVDERPALVRPAVEDGVALGLDRGAGDRALAAPVPARNATH